MDRRTVSLGILSAAACISLPTIVRASPKTIEDYISYIEDWFPLGTRTGYRRDYKNELFTIEMLDGSIRKYKGQWRRVPGMRGSFIDVSVTGERFENIWGSDGPDPITYPSQKVAVEASLDAFNDWARGRNGKLYWRDWRKTWFAFRDYTKKYSAWIGGGSYGKGSIPESATEFHITPSLLVSEKPILPVGVDPTYSH